MLKITDTKATGCTICDIKKDPELFTGSPELNGVGEIRRYHLQEDIKIEPILTNVDLRTGLETDIKEEDASSQSANNRSRSVSSTNNILSQSESPDSSRSISLVENGWLQPLIWRSANGQLDLSS